MRVQNSLGVAFDTDCRELAQKVMKEYKPDLLVGVYSGGFFVAEKIFEMGIFQDVRLINVIAQRPTTKKKKQLQLDALLPYLPQWFCNVLRTLEVAYQINKFNPQNIHKRNVVINDINLKYLECAKKILVIDDAVDSGVTLLSVLEFIEKHNPTAIVKTAALTVTFPNPIRYPDIFIYRNILLRFPWSADVNKKYG